MWRAMACGWHAWTATDRAPRRPRPRSGSRAVAHGLEVAEEASIPPAIDAVAKSLGRIDGLVNCAAITGRTNVKAHEVDLADFDSVYRINLRGALILSKAVLPHMLARTMAGSCTLHRSPARTAMPA